MWFAILLPGLSLYFNRRKALGVWLLFLQPTLIGWVVGAFIAVPNLKHRRRRRGVAHAPAPTTW